MQKQMEINAVPPRRRAVLVEDVASELPKNLRDPRGVFPALVIDARYPEGLKTEWYDPRTHVPKQLGFYEVMHNGVTMVAWYQMDEAAFYLSSGTKLPTDVSEPGFVWRGALVALGRQRRTLLEG